MGRARRRTLVCSFNGGIFDVRKKMPREPAQCECNTREDQHKRNRVINGQDHGKDKGRHGDADDELNQDSCTVHRSLTFSRWSDVNQHERCHGVKDNFACGHDETAYVKHEWFCASTEGQMTSECHEENSSWKSFSCI